MSLRWGALLRLTSCCFAFGRQDPAGQPPDATFRSDIKLIQVSVIAQDKHGKPVADLRRGDFRLLDNGSAREIRLFVAERSDSNPQPESKTPGVFTNRMASPGGSRSGYSVILIDGLFTDFGDPDKGEGSSLSRIQTLRMLRSRPLGEKIALYALGRKLQVICEFTADRDLLERQLGKWKPPVDTPDTANSILLGSLGATSDDHRGDAPEKAAEFTIVADAQVRATSRDEELILIADHLAGIPGRKNLIWLARRWGTAPPVLQRFRNANVSIYPVNVGGVACSECPPTGPTAVMNIIAAQTGGVAYSGRNDIDAAIGEAMDDGRFSYTLGFYQSGDERPRRVHNLEVRVSRPDVTLRYRPSYETEGPGVAANPKADLVKALNRPIDATAVSIKASAKRVRDRLDVLAVVDAGTLELTATRDRWTGRIEIAARFMTADGKPAGEVVSQTLNLNLGKTTYETALRQGIAYHNALKVPVKAVELRLLFANPASGKTGTLTIPLSAVTEGEAGAK